MNVSVHFCDFCNLPQSTSVCPIVYSWHLERHPLLYLYVYPPSVVCSSQEPLSPEYWKFPVVGCSLSWFLSGCHVLNGFRYWPNWGFGGMKKDRLIDIHTDKLRSGGLGSLMEEPQHPRSSVCLLYTAELGSGIILQKDKQGGRVVSYSWTRSRV